MTTSISTKEVITVVIKLWFYSLICILSLIFLLVTAITTLNVLISGTFNTSSYVTQFESYLYLFLLAPILSLVVIAIALGIVHIRTTCIKNVSKTNFNPINFAGSTFEEAENTVRTLNLLSIGNNQYLDRIGNQWKLVEDGRFYWLVVAPQEVSKKQKRF